MGEDMRSSSRSWRDPDGFVVDMDGKILRAVAPDQGGRVRELLMAPWMQSLIAQGIVPATIEIQSPLLTDSLSTNWTWFEHQRLRFPCYPHEITAWQLYDSALLTLKIGLEAAKHGWTLKDASAWNVLHSEGRAVFIDLLSFDRLPVTGIWRAYGQFVRHFVLPLLLHRRTGLTPPEIFLTHRDGITPERAFESLSTIRLLTPTALEHVLLPKLLARAGSRLIAAQTKQQPHAIDAEIATALPVNTLHRLQRAVHRLKPDEDKGASLWKRYEEERPHYSDSDIKAKTKFVKEHLGNTASVLDLGCNAGEFSQIAATAGASVFAADADHAVLSRLYGRIRATNHRITPLLLNIGRPTPAIGWLNTEIASFLDRSVDKFECILALGLFHHLLVSERATLGMICDLLRSFNAIRIIVEWVEPADPKFRQLAGFDSDLYNHLDCQAFEIQFAEKFELEAKLVLPCHTRVMYSWVATNPS